MTFPLQVNNWTNQKWRRLLLSLKSTLEQKIKILTHYHVSRVCCIYLLLLLLFCIYKYYSNYSLSLTCSTKESTCVPFIFTAWKISSMTPTTKLNTKYSVHILDYMKISGIHIHVHMPKIRPSLLASTPQPLGQWSTYVQYGHCRSRKSIRSHIPMYIV